MIDETEVDEVVVGVDTTQLDVDEIDVCIIDEIDYIVIIMRIDDDEVVEVEIDVRDECILVVLADDADEHDYILRYREMAVIIDDEVVEVVLAQGMQQLDETHDDVEARIIVNEAMGNIIDDEVVEVEPLVADIRTDEIDVNEYLLFVI